jgi:hypothetical protein
MVKIQRGMAALRFFERPLRVARGLSPQVDERRLHAMRMRRHPATTSRSTSLAGSLTMPAVTDVEIGRMDKNRAFLLPFGIDLRVEDGIVSIESNLPDALPVFSDPVENGRIVGVVEGVEQLLLSLARVGIDLSNPQFAEAIHDCVSNLHSA